MVQLLRLKSHEFEDVAQFMGHDPKVHMNYYKIQESTHQLAKINKLLLNMEKGNIKDMNGLNLDDLNVANESNSDSDFSIEREDIQENQNINRVKSYAKPDRILKNKVNRKTKSLYDIDYYPRITTP